jgi:hypothetical protein
MPLCGRLKFGVGTAVCGTVVDGGRGRGAVGSGEHATR